MVRRCRRLRRRHRPILVDLKSGDERRLGLGVDGVFTTGGEIELTRVWNVIAFYEHRWNPNWRTSWFGGYVQVDYNAAATTLINQRFIPAGAAACGVAPAPTTILVTSFTPLAGNSCSPDFSFYQVGSRTQWNPVAQLDIGLEVMYTRFNTAYAGPALVNVPLPQNPVLQLDDQDVYSVFFRWQRNFFP